MKKLTIKDWVIVGLIVLIAVLMIRGCVLDNKKDNAKQQVDLHERNDDSLTVEYNKKYKQWEAEKSTLVANNGQLTKFLEKNNTELAVLKKEKKATVGIITKTEIRIDTVVKNIVDTVKDTRTARISTPYYLADIVSSPETTSLGLSITDTVKYTIDKDFKLVATYKNPDLKIVELESFYVKPDTKTKNWKFWVGAAIPIALGTGVYILK